MDFEFSSEGSGSIQFSEEDWEHGRTMTSHESYIYKIMEEVNSGNLQAFYRLAQLEREGLEDFGLVSAAEKLDSAAMAEARRQIEISG